MSFAEAKQPACAGSEMPPYGGAELCAYAHSEIVRFADSEIVRFAHSERRKNMKLSFSTNHRSAKSVSDFIDEAVRYRYDGIELHDIYSVKENYRTVYRALIENRLSVPCIDAAGALSEDNGKEARECLFAAESLRCPYVRVKAGRDDAALLAELIAEAEKKKITILIETVGDLRTPTRF